MLVRGETTEERIAKIANGFGQGVDNFNQLQNQKRNQGLQEEALRRQQALDAQNSVNDQEDRAMRRQEFGINQELKKAQTAELGLPFDQTKDYKKAVALQAIKTNAKTGGISLTKGDESADREYGKNYNNFISKGIVNSKSSIDRLEAIADELERDQGIMEASGTKIPIPDWARSSDAIRRRETAKNAAFSTIKELLPGSVSDGDREAVTRDYYNDQLGAKENAAIIREKVQQLKSIRQLEMQKAQHFGENGTLKGFRGTLDQADSVNTKQSAPSKSPWEKYKK
jgi:hypothetical protein